MQCSVPVKELCTVLAIRTTVPYHYNMYTAYYLLTIINALLTMRKTGYNC